MQKQIFLLGCAFFCILMNGVSAAGRGIIVGASDRYVTDLVHSLAYLREELHCQLPIEVWHAGNELSPRAKRVLSQFQPIEIRDIKKVLGSLDSHYRGFQIKSHMLYATDFDEVILMDADVYFYQDPAVLFDSPRYKATGAYFFRDLEKWNFPPKAYTIDKYIGRRAFFRSLISEPSDYLPVEWSHYWLPDEDPVFDHRILESYQESGCVAFDKRRHQKGLEYIVWLNINRSVTYTHVLGDKETFWLGMEMAKEPYSVNDTFPSSIIRYNEEKTDVVHFVEGKLFYQQKEPIPVNEASYFDYDSGRRDLREEERKEINRLFLFQSSAKWEHLKG